MASASSSAASLKNTAAFAAPAKVTGLQGPKRRILYVGLYELIAIIVSSLIFMAIGQKASDSGVMAVAAAMVVRALVGGMTEEAPRELAA